MKKLLAILMIIVMIFMMVGCNYNVVDTKWNYNVAYVNFGDRVEKIPISSWSEDDTSFTLTAKDGRIICTHQMNVVLVKEE